MNDSQFTPEAKVLWTAIPPVAREKILANVFCVKCRKVVQITKFSGEEENGNIVLKGSCAVCGHEVARFVETSEIDRSNN